LYDADALLDEIDQEDATDPEDEIGLEDKSDGSLDLDDEDDLGDDVSDADADELDLEASREDPLLADEAESWSDDPVRMYLTQMGEIPLLTRQEEISLAKQIEVTRRKFRHKLLECDYVMQQAVRVLRRVHSGDLPFDRTVQVSVTDRLEKQQILGRLPYNLITLDVLLKRNRRADWVAPS
jgi:RNA polymerase primary sigma factor